MWEVPGCRGVSKGTGDGVREGTGVGGEGGKSQKGRLVQGTRADRAQGKKYKLSRIVMFRTTA